MFTGYFFLSVHHAFYFLGQYHSFYYFLVSAPFILIFLVSACTIHSIFWSVHHSFYFMGQRIIHSICFQCILHSIFLSVHHLFYFRTFAGASLEQEEVTTNISNHNTQVSGGKS